MPELITREFVGRAEADTAERTITGIAVPYGQIIERTNYQTDTRYERFEAGSVQPHPDGHMYFYGHGEPIGRVVSERDVTEPEPGHEVTARISQTVRGTEIHTLLLDGVLTKHSIGFYGVEFRIDKVRLTDDGPEVDVLTWTKVLARETSVVPFPAYDKAAVTQVRDRETEPHRKEDRMPPENPDGAVLTRADLDEVNDHLTKLERQMATIGDGEPGSADAGLLSGYRSHGEFLKALASGEARDHVEALNRAFADTGATVGDVAPGARPTWVDRDVKLVENRRPLVNLFNRDPLPTEGMSITYPTFDSKTGDVARQATEGAALELLKLKIKNATADVTTEGGAVELSKQVIDRMPASYLSKVLQMVKISYGKNTNNIVRARLMAVTVAASNPTIDISTFTDKAAAYVGAMVDAAGTIEDNSLGLGLDFVLANRADFKSLAGLTDDVGRPLFGVSGQAVNAIGDVNVKALTLDVGGVPWILDPGMSPVANPRACSAEALTVLESPGAPFQLTDENVINLTEAFSLYGYIASTVDDAKGIVQIKTQPAA